MLRIPLVMSQRCPWGQCAYCDVISIGDTGRFVYREPQAIVEDIALIEKVTGAGIFHFVDDCMVVPLAGQFAELLLANRRDIKWACALRPSSQITREMVETLSRSGLRSVFMGFESASNVVLERMHRGVTIEIATECLRNLTDFGIKVHGAVMFGFPGESQDDARLTQEWVMKHQDLIHRLDDSLFTLTPYSKVHRRPHDFGIEVVREGHGALTYSVPFTIGGSDQQRKMAIGFVKTMRACVSAGGKLTP